MKLSFMSKQDVEETVALPFVGRNSFPVVVPRGVMVGTVARSVWSGTGG